MSAQLVAKAVVAGALFICATLASATPAHSATRCDSTCLTGLATRYVDALAIEHWHELPWADTVHYAENSVKMMVGDGIGATATAHSMTPLIVADPVAGKVAWLGTIDEHGQPGFYAMELDATGATIGAVQSIIRRKEGRPPFGDPVTFTHSALFTAPLAAQHATDRNAMIRLANSFFTAQAARAGTVRVAFTSGCRLIENGVPMSGNLPAVKDEADDCTSAFQRGLFQEYESVRHRIVAVDAARGLLVAIGYRDMPAVDVKFEATDGKPYPAEAQYPRSMGFMSVFRIENGAIGWVETVASELPYMMPFPW